MGSYSRERYATESASFPKSANSAPASYSYATFADLPTSGSTPGNTAFVVATNRLYIWSGVGWYLIATVTNASPTAITGVSDTYTLATNGTATTVTAVSTDPEGFALSWSYSVSSGALNGTTVSQADNVFTITPHASNPTTFSITFNVTDGLNGSVSKVSAFTLAFTVTNSRYTALSVKATATGSNQTFDDASASNHTITVAGNSITSTFSPYRHGGYSAYFTTSGSTSGSGGTGQYIQSDLTSELTLDTNDFTISCWVYGISKLRNYPRILQIGPQNTPWGASQLSILYKHDSDNDSITLAMQGIGVNSLLIASGPINDNQWYHVALTRSGSTFTLYIDGVSVGTYTSTGSATGAGNKAILIGSASSGDSDFHGYISDVRVINGTSIYAGNFTPPTEPSTVVTNTKFLLSNLPYFKDKSASNHAITATGNASLRPKSLFDNGAYSEASHGASAYFDGTGDYLTGPSSATIGIGTGDFTIECWFYATDGTSIDRGIWETRTDGYPNNSDGLSLTRITETTFRVYGTSPLIVSSATTITNNWNHLAVVRNSGTLELFVNGVSQGTVSNSTNMNSSQPIAIGSGRYTTSNSTPTHAVKGYIQDFRVVKGTAVYTSNFTPPTAPLTNSPTYPAMAIGVANSGASAYTLSGDVTGSNATVNMAVGQTVNFTVNASGHPFYIRVSDGGANVSTPAATGQGATSGVVSWTPNTAGTYYYQCEIHAGMIGTINVTDGVKFLLNPEPSILDLSQSSEIQCFGDAATSTTQVKFAGTKSIYLDGTGDYLQINNYENSWISGYTGDYTIEFWWYPTNVSTGAAQEILTASNGFQFYISNGGGLSLAVSSNANNSFFWHPQDIHTMVINTWQHLAIVRNGNVYTIYVDGVSKATTTTSTLIETSTNAFQLGVYQGSLYPTVGYFQDLRVTKGLARYTSGFTPPTAELQG